MNSSGIIDFRNLKINLKNKTKQKHKQVFPFCCICVCVCVCVCACVCACMCVRACVCVSSTGSDAGDHPPITPMGSATRDQVRDSDWKLYDFITRHFLATVSLGSIKWELVFVCLEIGGKRGVNVNFIWAQLCRGGCKYAWVGFMANIGKLITL